MLKTKLFNQLQICSRIVGQPLEKLYDSAYNNLLRLANNNIVSDLNHVLHNKFELLPSNRRYRVPRFNKGLKDYKCYSMFDLNSCPD